MLVEERKGYYYKGFEPIVGFLEATGPGANLFLWGCLHWGVGMMARYGGRPVFHLLLPVLSLQIPLRFFLKEEEPLGEAQQVLSQDGSE